eukprot:scaffold732_cov265-Alexandrium_tamarense.AAC.3
MTIPHVNAAPVLLRSRSLMRGTYPSHGEEQSSISCCVSSSNEPSAWNSPPHTTTNDHANNPHLPPIIDDCSELEHARRISIAKSHGHTYDEATGVQDIFNSLTPHELKFLADDNMPLRHYRAEKGNLIEAIRKIKCTLRWREEFGVEDIKRCFDTKGNAHLSLEKQEELRQLADTIAHENETGKIYCRGYDKQGRAILYLTPGRENSTNELNNMKHLGHYPERMFRAYICDPPLVFRTFWSVIRHFVDPCTLEKIAFCSGKEGQTLLERDFDVDMTERQAGGQRDLRRFSSREFLFATSFDRTFDEKYVEE